MNSHLEEESVINPGQFQVHFIFEDKSHTMDALVLHECESELFALLKEIGKQLDVDFRIEASAYGEGGVTVFLRFIGSNAVALSLIGATITAICSAGVWMKYQSVLLQQQIAQNDFALNRDRKLADQQVEQNELSIKKARLELRKAEQEVSAEAPRAPSTKATRPLPLEPPPKAQDVVPALLSNSRVIKLRSQFYGHLLGYDKVSAVGFSPSHERSPADEMVVPRMGFSTYVVTSQELEPSVIRDAEIEIVSPVLKRGTFKWKGVVEKKPISFDLIDDDFLAKVDAKRVKFQSGTTLICDLEIHLRETVGGTPEPHAYVVRHVSRHFTKKGSVLIAESQSIPALRVDKDMVREIRISGPTQEQLSLLRLENDIDK